MAEQPSYEDLVALNNHLAQQLVGMGDRLQNTLREQMAKAWAEGYQRGATDEACGYEPADNPYKEA